MSLFIHKNFKNQLLVETGQIEVSRTDFEMSNCIIVLCTTIY